MAGTKSAAKPAAKKAAAPKKAPAARKEKPAARKKNPPADPLDLRAFPPEAIAREERWVCLACILDIFTRHLGMAAAKAQNQVRRYQPAIDELSAAALVRPYFKPAASGPGCPYCGAAAKWQAALGIVRIEGSKATDTLRLNLVKGLPEDQFYVVEEKTTQREALYDWLAKTEAALDTDSADWLMESALHWLGRRMPKEDWPAVFSGIVAVRRSRRVEEGYAVDQGRLFLAPHVFDEILLAQYLLSRAHKSGGLTFEGRMTLQDLFFRLRGGGYLRTMGVTAGNASDALEQLIELLGGEEGMKYYYVVDRRAFLERLKDLKGVRIPKAKPALKHFSAGRG